METGVVVAFVYCMVLIGLWLSGYIETEELSAEVHCIAHAPEPPVEAMLDFFDLGETSLCEHRAELAAVVGRQRLRALPALAQRAGGQVVDSLARSHRISSAAFSEVAGWRPARNGIEGWRSVA